MRIATLCGLLLLIAADLPADGPIRLKTRTVVAPVYWRLGARHLVVQFAGRPGPRVLSELARRRIRVLSFIPESSLMIAGDGAPDLRGLDVTWVGPLEPADKISPALAADQGEVYLLMFHPDVDGITARALAQQGGLQILENPGLLPGHLLAAGSRERVLRLAERDELAYILPARTELALRRSVYGCPGALMPAGPLAEYALAGSGWPKDPGGGVSLGYFFQTLAPHLDANTSRNEIERALAEWSRYANVTFRPAAQSAARSIDILFASGAHGDPYPFTSSAVLAHTFYPAPPNTEPVAGDMHLNASEPWAVGSSIDVFSVALHEAGHVLGLGHSDHPESVMYPYYKLASGLTSDDIAAVQALYGPPSGTPVNPPPPGGNAPGAPSGSGSGSGTGTPGGGTGTPTGTSGGPTPSGSSDTTPPAITITSPASTIVFTAASSITLSGTATDNVGVVSVKWTTSTGSSGTASGTANWSAQAPLFVGTNVVTVRAYDAAGNSGWRAVTVIRQ